MGGGQREVGGSPFSYGDKVLRWWPRYEKERVKDLFLAGKALTRNSQVSPSTSRQYFFPFFSYAFPSIWVFFSFLYSRKVLKTLSLKSGFGIEI